MAGDGFRLPAERLPATHAGAGLADRRRWLRVPRPRVRLSRARGRRRGWLARDERLLLGRKLVLRVDQRAGRRRHGTVNSGSSVANHPSLEPRSQVRRDVGVRRIIDHVAPFAGIEEQVVQRLARDGPLRPAAGDVGVLARAVVTVGQDREQVVVKPPDVLEALGPDRALGLVGGVVRELGEDLGPGTGWFVAG